MKRGELIAVILMSVFLFSFAMVTITKVIKLSTQMEQCALAIKKESIHNQEKKDE